MKGTAFYLGSFPAQIFALGDPCDHPYCRKPAEHVNAWLIYGQIYTLTLCDSCTVVAIHRIDNADFKRTNL